MEIAHGYPNAQGLVKMLVQVPPVAKQGHVLIAMSYDEDDILVEIAQAPTGWNRLEGPAIMFKEVMDDEPTSVTFHLKSTGNNTWHYVKILCVGIKEED